MSPAEESWCLRGSDQSRRPGARGGEITQHKGPGMFSSQEGRNLKSTLLKCSETSQYGNTNTDHRHGTDELGHVTGPREDACPCSPRTRRCCRPQGQWKAGEGRERAKILREAGLGTPFPLPGRGSELVSWGPSPPVATLGGTGLWAQWGGGGGAWGAKAGVSSPATLRPSFSSSTAEVCVRPTGQPQNIPGHSA